MLAITRYILLILSLIPALAVAQSAITGHIFSAASKEPVPFATIKFAESGRGVVADLNGRYEIPAEIADNIKWVEISALGYKSLKKDIPQVTYDFFLQPSNNDLSEIVVKPHYEKIRRILNNAMANKDHNNPDKYDWHRCHVYYKMTADVSFPDSLTADSSLSKKRRDFFDGRHLLMSETYSIRTWQKPQKLQEDVIASRLSGFKHPLFSSLVTDVLPFHAYNDYIALNNNDYHNPISAGSWKHYSFSLADELIEDGDTVWVLSFLPRGANANELKGSVYINSNGYALSRIIAGSHDTMRKLHIRLEQEYEKHTTTDGRNWFPRHLNYIIDWDLKSDGKVVNVFMKGNSNIDSVTWDEDKDFKFDKSHTIRLSDNIAEITDSTWRIMRPTALNTKESNTYKTMDSIGKVIHLDNAVRLFARLPEGRLSVHTIDIDLLRLFSYNRYENVRLGAGLQTNEKLLKWASVGGWAGYGFGDKQWKYGVFTEAYLDRYKEFAIRAGYTDDIYDPGRVQINSDLDKNYLRSYLLSRVDRVRTWSVSVKKKIGYLNLELSGTKQDISPQYQYSLQYDSKASSSFSATEASLCLRYAFAERTAPFFGQYYGTGSRYPTFYSKITYGNLQYENGDQTAYAQAIGAALWHKHINRVGNEHLLLEAGIAHSQNDLPLSKLFAGNGFRYSGKNALDQAIYAFGGMLTMYPYGYYSNRFINFFFRHDADWKLYRLSPGRTISSAPYMCVQYNMLYGKLNNRSAHHSVSFDVPDNAYHEAGLLLNNILRLNANIYYLTFNAAYFYHITPTADFSKNNRFVYGISFEI
jgi:hypothetical protein